MKDFPDVSAMKGKTLLDRVRARGRFRTEFVGETLTKGSFKASVDVNTIMEAFRRNRVIPQVGGGRFEDLGSPIDYQEAQNLVLEAGQAFDSLPARTRDRFGNDPQQLLRFLADPQNREEAIKLGLVKAPELPPDQAEPGGDGAKPPAPKPA